MTSAMVFFELMRNDYIFVLINIRKSKQTFLLSLSFIRRKRNDQLEVQSIKDQLIFILFWIGLNWILQGVLAQFKNNQMVNNACLWWVTALFLLPSEIK